MIDRLSPLAASFLAMETASMPLHVGGVGVFAPGLAYADVFTTLRERLDSVPLARKRLVDPGPGAGRAVWVDDTDFDLSYHVRHAALPAPGDHGQLGEYLSRLISRPLDRHRPLWEMYVIDGLAGGRTALFRKVHLAIAGGDVGDYFAVLLSDRRTGPPAAEVGQRWEPAPTPSAPSLYLDAARRRLGAAGRVVRGAGQVASSPRRVVQAAGEAGEAAVGLAARLLRSAPPSPLNRRLSAHRRFAFASCELEDLRAVRRAFGGTINDAVVAVVADAVGRLLRWRGHETKDLDLRVMVPVRVDDGASELESRLPRAVRGVGSARTIGKGVVGVLAPLPVMAMDPVARLYRIMGEMAGLKESRQAVAADQLVRIAGYGPPTLHAMAARVASADQRFNVALSNAPGPQTKRYLCGIALEESYPFIPLTGDCALSVAVNSYSGRVDFGLLGDRDALFDLEVLAGFVGDAVGELREAAAAATREQRAKVRKR